MVEHTEMEANSHTGKESVSSKFAKNSILNMLGFAITFPILILLTPYMLKVLGDVRFGVWALVGVMASFALLSDAGMTTAIVKFVAEHWVRKDVDRISSIASTAFLSFVIIGGLLTSFALLFRQYIVIDLLKVPAVFQSEALFVITGAILIFYFNVIFGVFNSLLLGLQRMDVTNAIAVTTKVLRAIGMYLVLSSGFGLSGLIINSAVFSALTIAINIYWAKKLIKGLRISPFLSSINEFKHIFIYSINILSARLINFGQDPASKVIVAAYTSLTYVTLYEIGTRIQQTFGQFISIGLAPLLPASSELYSLKNLDEIKKIYFSISRLLYLLVIPIILLIIILAEPLIDIWLGEGYQLAARAVQFILIGQIIILLVTPQYLILQGIERPGINTIAQSIGSILNIGLSILLVSYAGFYGVLWGGVISILIAAIYTDIFFRRITGIKFKDYLIIVPFRSILTASFLTAGLNSSKVYFGTIEIYQLILLIFSFLLLYLISLKFGKLMNDNDWQLIRKSIRSLRSQSQVEI